MVVLVTGAGGQLGQALQSIAGKYTDIDFVFCDSSTLDITNSKNVSQVFQQIKPNFCINAAAYTAVDKAESEPEQAHAINVIGAKNIAEACKNQDCILLHISTDFVFDGKKSSPYTEEDLPNPTGVYGQTKLDGEKAIQSTFEQYYIIRTAWVYSSFGNNFMKTMLRLANERDTISVVNDQMGTPTHAVDLAEVLIKIILTNNLQPTTHNFGIYHFSNEGHCSWFDFAKKIFEIHHKKVNLIPIPTTAFPTAAKRPKYSVLDKTKIKRFLGLVIKDWDIILKDS